MIQLTTSKNYYRHLLANMHRRTQQLLHEENIAGSTQLLYYRKSYTQTDPLYSHTLRVP